MKSQRFCAFVMVFAIMFCLFFSVTFPSVRANHVHENEETCAVCATIEECNELARFLSTAVRSSGNFTPPVVKSSVADGGRQCALFSYSETPVHLKVKLIN